MEEKEQGASYTADPSIFLDRAVKAQADKIKRQTIQLARLNRVVKLIASEMKIRDVLFLLWEVILNKLKIK